MLLLVWRTGYYTFLNTHIGHAGAHHLNEVILVFLIRLIINYLDVNCFAVDGKIKYHKQGAESGQGSWRREGETKRPRKVPVGPNSARAWRKVLSAPLQPQGVPLGFMWLHVTTILEDSIKARALQSKAPSSNPRNAM